MIMPVQYQLRSLVRTVFAVSIIIGLFPPIPTQAQDANRAIAFVQAPEQSAGMCFGNSVEEAFTCAVSQCTANGTLAEDCLPQTSGARIRGARYDKHVDGIRGQRPPTAL